MRDEVLPADTAGSYWGLKALRVNTTLVHKVALSFEFCSPSSSESAEKPATFCRGLMYILLPNCSRFAADCFCTQGASQHYNTSITFCPYRWLAEQPSKKSLLNLSIMGERQWTPQQVLWSCFLHHRSQVNYLGEFCQAQHCLGGTFCRSVLIRKAKITIFVCTWEWVAPMLNWTASLEGSTARLRELAISA